MTAEVKREDPATCGLGPAGRTGPLAHFIQKGQNGSDTKLLRQRGENASKSDAGRSFSRANTKRKSKRPTGKSDCTQCRDRRPKHSTSGTTNDSRRKQATQSRHAHGTARNNGRHDSASNKAIRKRAWTAPTLKCDYCGHDVTFTNENRCEDCFANDQQIWHGNATRVKLETPGE